MALSIALASVTPFSSETARARVVAVLEDRFDSEVELHDLRLRFLPRLRAEGHGLTIRHKGRRDVPPLISVAHFSAEASISHVLRRHLTLLTVDGLDIEIPPDRNRDSGDSDTEPHRNRPLRQQREAAGAEGNEAESSTTNNDRSRTFVIDEMISNDSRLVIIPKEQDKPSKVWAIHALRMHNLGIDRAMPFEATLTNAVPPGEIGTKGSFGPWHAEVPGETPLDGTFRFDHADLGVFKGVAGILAARGTFGGTLARIDIHGDTDTPQFTVTAGRHPVPLHATYHAIVDGTTGNTLLESVNGSFLNTSLVAKGSVIGTLGKEGRTVTLEITMNRARLEDLLTLTLKAPKPPMIGALQLKAKFVLPPGDQDVVKKLRLDGKFTIAGTRFTNQDVQQKINELSRRSRGKSPLANTERVASQFNGTFKLSRGTLTIPEVTFDVPGSLVRLTGTYDLLPETVNFTGTVLMDATISQMTTGFKSKLLKIIDPIFAKKGGGGTEIPIKISGSRNNPSFGLDKGGLFKRRNDAASR